MITLITGLPGNGKTLYALAWLQEKAAKESRQVYYSGIADLRIPGWIELPDPTTWAKLPSNSILVVDEAQRIFRPRMHGSNVPDFVAALETHRHLGIDLVFITQHPMLVDANVRRLVGQHFHIIRKFGTHFATIHEWGKVKETCDKNRDDSVRHEWRFPAAVFDQYKSAEVHTVKRRIPVKVWLLLSMPLIIGGLVYLGWTRLDPNRVAARSSLAAGNVEGAGNSPTRPPGNGQKLNAGEYVAQFAPRVTGLDYTAPIFDQVTAPVEAPYPAACISMGTRCGCYSQQATRLNVPDSLCRELVAGGFFVAWRQPERVQARQAQADPPLDQRYSLASPNIRQAPPGVWGPFAPMASSPAANDVVPPQRRPPARRAPGT